MTERVQIALARALITNPEVLVVHKPSLVFDDATAAATLS